MAEFVLARRGLFAKLVWFLGLAAGSSKSSKIRLQKHCGEELPFIFRESDRDAARPGATKYACDAAGNLGAHLGRP